MLRELRVRNFALIDELSAEFSPGFNVLTGETGAGKSIIIDALSLALGARAIAVHLPAGMPEASVEAAFDVRGRRDIHDLLAAEGIDHDPDEDLIMRRQILKDGRNRVHINGSLASVSTLRALGDHLVDIHGQGEGQSLQDVGRHLALLDAYGGLAGEATEMRLLYQRLRSLRQELEGLEAQVGGRAERRDVLDFQRKEIEGARLRPGEEEEIKAERDLLTNAERLYQASDAVYQALYAEEGSLLQRLRALIAKGRDASRLDARLNPHFEACEAAYNLLHEAASSLREYRDRVEFDPGRLEELELRLHEIAKLKRKYGGTVEEVLRQAQEITAELGRLEGIEERMEALNKALRESAVEAAARATELSLKRSKAADGLSRQIAQELAELGMPKARFQVRLSAEEDPEGLVEVEGRRYRLRPSGFDQAEFLVSLNPGEDLKPLSKVASGGELSRVMLSIRSILAAIDEIPVLIFDEIDAGIGGSMGDVVGRKLSSLARERQVICVTHLAQISSYADSHFQVEKQVVGGKARTRLRRLPEEERAAELARMLGGRKRSDIPLRHAQEILEAAHRWKKGKDALRQTHKEV
ncbi:MAG: DNA repair protein RecN [candidate division NC10 bacterium]|nr:DNA repair protein RecN [candidate division NC10 bacterium]